MSSPVPCPESGTAAFHRGLPGAAGAGELWCEGTRVAALAERFGTPLYVYSGRAIDERAERLRRAFGADATICYAVKANSNLTLLRRLAGHGLGFDVVSGGELQRLAIAGLATDHVVFAGVAKEPWEIAAAVAADILFFNVESEHELALLAAAGATAGRRLRVALRLNPDVEAGTHAYITTGKKQNKFGIGLGRAADVVRRIVAEPWLELAGYHVHLGSQLRSVAPYVDAFERVAAFADADPAHREGVTHYDLGGGFGISYGEGDELDVAAVAEALLPRLSARGWRPVLEPGRYLVGDAGVLVTRVLGTKGQSQPGSPAAAGGGGTEFVLVDAAMNDLVRPALYQAEHPIAPVAAPRAERRTVDVVGPVCETGDFLARGRQLPATVAGDLLAVFAAGAYGASMASNYNSRRRPAEVLVDGDRARLVRRRETFEQLTANEVEIDES
ncbi:MAG: diaminopimelate decarboxylase [Planctomycetes bacterium]|nr:diaminopimelate decarboxylase [Planctomycetota bacterium]